MRICFRATEEQVLRVMVNAINASAPVGMGRIQYQQKDYTVSDLEKTLTRRIGGISVDYYEGRMVKLRITKDKDVWSVNDSVRSDYQSWQWRYPTMRDLLSSVDGIEIG